MKKASGDRGMVGGEEGGGGEGGVVVIVREQCDRVYVSSLLVFVAGDFFCH